MRSGKPGRSTSPRAAEVENISPHGIWMLVLGVEFFLPFEDYPWFREARVREIQNVELLFDSHLHWPDLDVDLEIETLIHPEQYPLKYQVAASTTPQQAKPRAQPGRPARGARTPSRPDRPGL